MGCDRETIMLISVYADGEATSEEKALAKAHLEHCRECRALVDGWSEQQRMFEWAYTIELPEESKIDWTSASAQKGKKMSIIEKMSNELSVMSRYRKSLGWVGALAAALIVGIFVYRFATLPPLMRIGTETAAGKTSVIARTEDDVQLTVGPDSIVRRIDEKSIRLVKGFVFASVRHGAGLRILTPRLEVRDQGTRFEVGTGTKLDYVLVEEGRVSVSKRGRQHEVRQDQILFAGNDGEARVGELPKLNDFDKVSGMTLTENAFVSLPASAVDLDWRDGLKRLALRFPYLRFSCGRDNGVSEVGEGALALSSREGMVTLSGLRERLRSHYSDIARVASGMPCSSGPWEVPVCIMQVTGLSLNPKLPGDVYYVSLVPKDGTIVWRFIGSLGMQADYPFVFGKLHNPLNYNEGPLKSTGTESVVKTDENGKLSLVEMKELYISEFPGDSKPTLKLVVPGVPVSEIDKDRVEMLTEIIRNVPKIKGQDFDHPNSSLLYLDEARKHRILVAWRRDVGKELCLLTDRLRQGKGGTVVLGALASDVALEDPKLSPGIYLIKFVQQASGASPHLELAHQNGGGRYALRSVEPLENYGGWHLESLPGYGTMSLQGSVDDKYKAKYEANGLFPFRVSIVGRPDDRNTRVITKTNSDGNRSWSSRQPTKPWVEGGFLIKKP